MPKAKDLTGDLHKLSKRQILPQGEAPVMPQEHRLGRKPAFNGSSFFFWLLISFFLALQVLFLFWLGA
ncbi:MAG: hypothetical protein ACO3ZW_02370 [Opitutales bacterium]|jgi:hypothetical protein